MLCRVIDGLARLGIRYTVQWPDDAGAEIETTVESQTKA
jgi:hypothetical protein